MRMYINENKDLVNPTSTLANGAPLVGDISLVEAWARSLRH